MTFEHFLTIISIFSVFPFDNMLDLISVPINEDQFRDIYTQYINSNLFQSDLKDNHLSYIEKPGYYENLIEKFVISSKTLTIPKNCRTDSALTNELRMQFIKYIQFQEFKVVEFLLIKFSPFILPTYFVYAIFPHLKISYAILFTIKGTIFYQNLIFLFIVQNLNRNQNNSDASIDYSIHILGKVSKFLKEFFGW